MLQQILSITITYYIDRMSLRKSKNVILEIYQIFQEDSGKTAKLDLD